MRAFSTVRQHPKCILRLVGAYGSETSDLPGQFVTPSASFFEKRSEMEAEQLPLREIHATLSGGFLAVGARGSIFGFGNNYSGDIGLEREYTESWMRPRFNLDPNHFRIQRLKWLQCGAQNSFAYINCFSPRENREVDILCGTGKTLDGLMGDVETDSRSDGVKSFTPLKIPLRDGFSEVILGVANQGLSTLVWTLRPDGTNGVYGTGINMSKEISMKEENLREFTDLTKEYFNDLPSENDHIVEISKTLTSTHVLLSNGKVYSRGRGRNCELGTNKLFEPHLNEVAIPYAKDEKVVKIVSGSHHCLALTAVTNPATGQKIHRLFEWGAGNFSGRVITGQSTDPNHTHPTADRFPVREITNSYIPYNDPIRSIHCGTKMTYVITQSGQIFCTGDGSDGQFGVDPDLKSDELPKLGHYKNMTHYLVPPRERIVTMATSNHSALLWTEEI